MSKIKKAKEEQGYIDKVEPAVCGNCAHFQSEKTPSKWLVDRNQQAAAKGEPAPYPQHVLDANASERNLRCGIGGFAVKKTGSCRSHQRKGMAQ